jgi:hypothetical protein
MIAFAFVASIRGLEQGEDDEDAVAVAEALVSAVCVLLDCDLSLRQVK